MPITIKGSGTVTGISAGGLPDDCITTADIAANAVTTAKLGSDEVSGLCKAWVNFNGTSNSSNLSGTYSRTLTTVTVTATAHGLIAGNSVYLDFTSGAAADGTFTVTTVIDVDNFEVTHGTSGSTSGNVTIRRNLIRASYNVSSITDNGTGNYTVNFTTAMADANYSAVFANGNDSTGNTGIRGFNAVSTQITPTVNAIRCSSWSGTPRTLEDSAFLYVAIFR